MLKLPQTAWVVSCKGRFDAIFGFWARDSIEFYNIVFDILNHYSKHILTKDVAVNISWKICGRDWLVDEPCDRTAGDFGGVLGNEKIDKTDSEILSFLTKNSRTPIVEIAGALGVSSSNVLYRIRRLEKRKIIVRNGMNLGLDKLGYEFCKVLVYLQNVTRKRFDELAEHCADCPHVQAVVPVIAPWDFELELEVENFEHMSRIMNGIKRKFGDIIKHYETCVITKESGRRYIPK